jgi:high-affinity iron transporter
MLLNAVILVLREVIEASMLISLFLAFRQRSGQPKIVVLPALFLGLLAALLYAINIHAISQWLEGAGQEVINSAICLLIYLFLLLFISTAIRPNSKWAQSLSSISIIAGITLATAQEGTEIMLYIYGFNTIPDLFKPVLFGSLIGAGIGLSFGIFIYYLLVNASKRTGLMIGFIMLLLVAGSMALQITQLLAQVDLIPSQYPLWNSSAFISERSLTGQLLYALIGYEATPTAIQVISYLASLTVLLTISSALYFFRPKR